MVGARDQVITDTYALYLGDCIEVMASLPPASVHLSLYSPPFAGLYHYSSHAADLSNNRTREEFWAHYQFVVDGLTRLTMPGRMSAVHCADIPTSNSGTRDGLYDFPGDVIRLYERNGWQFIARYAVWKEPFKVRMRTLAKGLAHRTIIEDAARCSNAGADYLVVFRAPGENTIPIAHPIGFTSYAGAREVPGDLRGYAGWTGSHLENRYSHWVWRQYASAFWDDVRVDRVLPYKPAKDAEDEKHVHPLQLDVIERIVQLWSNPGEVICTPFMGVGSEVYGAVLHSRKGLGIELKPAYFRQAVQNMTTSLGDNTQTPLFTEAEEFHVTEDAYDTAVRSAKAVSPGSWNT